MPEFHVEVVDVSSCAAQLLTQPSGLSKQQVKQAMKKGAVWVSENGSNHKRLRRADKYLKLGQTIHLYYDPKVLEAQVTPAVLIKHEGDYSIWYKPYGMLSQGTKWGDHCTINRWVEQNQKPQRPAFIVNRLDRAAQGLMLIAHTKAAAAGLSRLFEQRKIIKTYTALVEGLFPETLVLNTPIDELGAISRASLLTYDSSAKQSLVSVSIETGRKHQIRKHLSGAGFAIIGDRLYGSKEADGDVDLCLVSTYLEFICPLTQVEKSYRLTDAYLPKLARLHD
ncbi:MAG: RNA pseudouridine synthase [Oceanospirillaceae bacterium]|nr:RNA pseudouridine synthase [Oceanospirillaceae bacterium]